jgi:hypothetical protein
MERERLVGQGGGQCAPVEIQASISMPNSACVPGAGLRPSPGCHAHPTRGSVAMWVRMSAKLRPPFRARSLSWPQISPSVLPCHAMETGARPQRGLPGMLAMDEPTVATFELPWHDLHGNPGAP